MNKRRIFAPLTKFTFLLPEAFEIVVSGKLYSRAERGGTLHKNFSFRVTPAGAAGNLGQQLKGAFTGPKIRHVQSYVGVDDPDQRNVGKIESFCDHLRPDKNIDFANSKRMERLLIRTFSAHRIRVHSGRGRHREEFLHRAFDFFSPESSVAD